MTADPEMAEPDPNGPAGLVRTSAAEERPQQGEPCPDGRCAAGLACVEYYGVAGPRGGLFTSCEIRCSDYTTCPADQQCVTISDGPGQVCRPGPRET